MGSRLTAIGYVIMGSVLVPIALGALSAIGLSRASDGGDTFAFARSYYDDVTAGFSPYNEKREQFVFMGRERFGALVTGRTKCQWELVKQGEEETLVSGALAAQRSQILEGIFDDPGVRAVNSMPSVLIGALKGCRSTLFARACDHWSRAVISRENVSKSKVLEKERRDWLSSHEKTMCRVADALDGRG